MKELKDARITVISMQDLLAWKAAKRAYRAMRGPSFLHLRFQMQRV